MCMFYINYEECKFPDGEIGQAIFKSFILTMRNVNKELKILIIIETTVLY